MTPNQEAEGAGQLSQGRKGRMTGALAQAQYQQTHKDEQNEKSSSSSQLWLQILPLCQVVCPVKRALTSDSLCPGLLDHGGDKESSHWLDIGPVSIHSQETEMCAVYQG